MQKPCRIDYPIIEKLIAEHRGIIIGSKEAHYEAREFNELVEAYISYDAKKHNMTGKDYYYNYIEKKDKYINMVWMALVKAKIITVFCANDTAVKLTKVVLFDGEVKRDYELEHKDEYVEEATNNYINLYDPAIATDYIKIKDISSFTHFSMLKHLINKNYPDETIRRYCFDVFHIPYKEGDTLKFNFITGNPPYNGYSEDGKYSSVLYVDFVNIAKKLGDKFKFIIPAKGALRTADQKSNSEQRLWNELLHDEHFRIDTYYQKSTEIFDAGIEDGVAIVTYDKNSIFPNSDRKLYNKTEGNTLLAKINDAYNSINVTNKFSSIVIRYNYRFKKNMFEEYRDVIEEIKKSQGHKKQDEIRLEQWECNEFTFIHSDVYDMNTTYKIWINHSENNFIYVKKEYIDSDFHDIDTYRVAFMASSSSDNYCKKNAKKDFFILEPNELISRRYFSTSAHTKEECENIFKYMQTVFFNASFCVKSDDHNRNAQSFYYAPLEDFTSKSDVPWDKSIDEIDKYLFNKYNFSDEVIACIDKAFIHQEKVARKRGKKTN